MKKRIVASALFAATGFIGAASAADMPTKAPPMVAAYNWSGWYAGLNAGAAVDAARVNTSIVSNATGNYFADSSVPLVNAAGAHTFHTPGFTGGAQLGYNHQMSNLLVGVETDFNYMGLKGSNTTTAPYAPQFAPSVFTITQSVKTDWLYTLRGRVGYAANNWLFYGTGGLAVTSIKYNALFTDTFGTGATETGSINKTKAGWTAGAGVEYALMGGPWTVKVEYLHVDFGSASTTSNNLTFAGVGFPLSVFAHSVRLSDDIVRAGVNYRFSR